jgi:cysteine desulfurase
MKSAPIYLDYNATTPVDPRVLQEMLPYFSEKFGNAASRAHSYGWVAQEAVEHARGQLAGLIHAEPEEIIFTSGATESINLALKGAFEVYAPAGRNHLVVLQTEHKAVLDTCEYLSGRGAEITWLGVNVDGLADVQELRKALRPETFLVSAIYANNETGTIQPVRQIGELAHEHGALFLSDATQALGKVEVDVQHDHIDLLPVSAHKFYGPKGAGALYIRRRNPRVKLMPLLHGGGHERALRSGTLNVPGVVGLGAAAAIAGEELWKDNMRISLLRTRLEQELLDLGGVFIHGSTRFRLPNTSSLSFEGVSSSSILKEAAGIAVAVGSACTSANPEPSHVLKAMRVSDQLALSSLRFSLGKFTTDEEISTAIEAVKRAVHKLRANG